MNFKINKRSYKLKDDWFNITLADAVRLTKTQDKIERLAILSDCPIDVLRKTEPLHLQVLYDYVEDYINAIYKIDIENYPVMGLSKYKHKGVNYYMPEGVEIADNYVPMINEPSHNILEAQEVLKHISELETKGIEFMNVLCAIYLKEKQGLINDKDIARRSLAFKDLPMFVVFEVFFCIHFSLVNFFIETRFCSIQKKSLKEKIIGYILSPKQELREHLMK